MSKICVNASPLLFSLLLLGSLQSLQAWADLTPPKPAALDESAVIENLIFSSGADPKAPQALWKKIKEAKPDLVVWLGNNLAWVGAQHLSPSALYHLQSLQPDFAVFRSQVPVIGTWDNSDYGTRSPRNNGKENAEGLSSKAEYLKFFPIDALKIEPRQEGIYHSFILGPVGKRVQVLILDEQSFRTPLQESKSVSYPRGPYQPDPSNKATLLGSAQMKWLEAEFKKPAEVRILVSAEQFLSESHGYESWGNFPISKKGLRTLLQKAKIKNLLILSGNRMHGEIHREQTKSMEIIDATAGGLNVIQPSADLRTRTRFGSLINEANFGWLEIRWPDHQASVHLMTAKGEKASVHWEW